MLHSLRKAQNMLWRITNGAVEFRCDFQTKSHVEFTATIKPIKVTSSFPGGEGEIVLTIVGWGVFKEMPG